MRAAARFLLNADEALAPEIAGGHVIRWSHEHGIADKVVATALLTPAAVILSFLLFICIRRCACLFRGHVGDEEMELPRRGPMGLTKDAIRSLPLASFEKSAPAAAPAEVTDCSICLEEFNDGEAVRVLPECGHGFHRECIDVWLRKKASCPSCRSCLGAKHAAPVRDVAVDLHAGAFVCTMVNHQLL